jgi:hypothetical protein
MTKRSITVALVLSLILVLATFLIYKVSKQKPSFRDATVLQGEADLAIPPGFWIEYDPVEQRYTHCHDSYGVKSCWRSFHIREEAIRDAQHFANYLKEKTKDSR